MATKIDQPARRELSVFGAITPAMERKLQHYASLLTQWNKRINLIGKSTEGEIWERHILDSARLLPFIPPTARILTDLGGGAGLPGLILAIVRPELEVHLIESDQRKAVFLQEAFRVTQTHGKVHAARVEELKPWPSDVITARAFAPLNRLIEYAQPFMGKDYLCIFSKGCKAGDEIEEAKKRWVIDYEVHPGSEKEQGVILIIKRVSKHA